MTKDNPRVQVFCHFNASDAKHSDQSLPNLPIPVSVPLSVPPTPSLAPAPSSFCNSLYALFTLERIVAHLPRHKWEFWAVASDRHGTVGEWGSWWWAAAQADDAANELLPDFQWHSTAAEATAATAKATATTRAAASKCDMSRDLNWRCCRKCALICQRTLPNTPIPRQASL